MSDPDATGEKLTKAALRHQIRRFIDEDPGDDDDLMDLGLTSISLMQLVTAWKAAGLDVGFMELARCTTVNSLWIRLNDRASGRPANRVAAPGAGAAARP